MLLTEHTQSTVSSAHAGKGNYQDLKGKHVIDLLYVQTLKVEVNLDRPSIIIFMS